MPYYAADDLCRIYYEEHGQGRPLVLIHGCNCNHHFFEKNVPELAKYFHILTFDLRKHGLSDHTEKNTTIRQCAKDLKNLMDYCGLEHPVLLGHSFGAYVAFEYIKQYGCENISGLIIDDMTAKMINDENNDMGTFAGWDEAIAYMKVQAGDFEAFAKDATITMYGPDPERPEDLAWCEEQLLMNGSVLPFNIACITADYTDVLPLIKVPVLCTYGTRKSFYTPDVTEKVAARIKDCRIRAFDGGHLHNAQDADNWNRAVIDFVKNLL